MAKKISANLSSDQSIVVSRFQIDPANFTLSSLPDTSITSPVNGNFLSYYNNNWVNVDATTARTNLGLGSLATLNSLAFADLTDKPTTITGYGITDAFDGATSSLTGDIDLTSQVTGILPVANMAATALTTVQTAATQEAQLALVTEEGDVVVRSDELKTYMHNGGSAGTMADFTLLATSTDSVTSVDGSTGAVTTLQLGTSPTTALAGDTVIPDVSDFITASSTEILTNKSIDATQLTGTIESAILPSSITNITSVGALTGLQVGSFSNGPTVMFAMGGTGSEGDAGYVAKGNFTVFGAANLNLTGENLSFGSTNTMSFGGRAAFQYPIDITADFSQDNTNLFLYNTNVSAINSGSSIVFGAKYDSTNISTFLSEGPYIASYKVNATDNDYSFGLKFATIKNGATSQAVAMTIDEDQNVGINGTLDVNSDTLRITETSASLPYPDTGLVPAIELYRNVGSPVDIHNIGHLRFYGNADNNVKTEYASINVEVRDTDRIAINPKMYFDLGDNDDDTNAIITTRVMTLSKGGVIAGVPFTAYDAMTLSSTSDDENAGPTLFLYRNSPTVADSDVLGRIEFQGRKIVSGGTLSQGGAETYAHIQAKVTDKTFESEDGELILSTMTAGADTEVLTLSGVGSTFNGALTVNSDLYLQGSNHLEYKGQSIVGDASSPYDTELNITNPTADRTISLPDDSGTLSLDGENQTSYRTGEIIEVVTGYADGSTISGQATSAGAARNFALEDVTAAQELTTSYAKINGTLVTYLPPVGTKTLEIEYGLHIGQGGGFLIGMHHKLSVGGTYVTNTRMSYRDLSSSNKYLVLKSILTVDGSGDVAAGNVDSWSSAIALQLDGRDYSSGFKLHITGAYDGSTATEDQIVVPPSVKITAIG